MTRLARRIVLVLAALGVVGGLVTWVGPAAIRPLRTTVDWHDYGSVIDWTVRRRGCAPHGFVRTYEVTHWNAADGDAARLDDVRAEYAGSPVPRGTTAEWDDRRPQHLVWGGNVPPRGRSPLVRVAVQGSSWTLPYSLVVGPCAAVLAVAGLGRVRLSTRRVTPAR